jgi:hypothetical protein
MNWTQAYATFFVPALMARIAVEVAPEPFGLAAAAGTFLVFAALGNRFEAYFFREVVEGKAKFPRLLRFTAGLPAVYVLAIILGVALAHFVSEAAVLLATLPALAAGLCLLCLDNHHRGRRLFTERYVRAVAERNLPADCESVPFGGVPVATEQLTNHTCFVGTTGSGKSSCIKEIMSALLPRISQERESQRALIYDPKTEFFGYATALANCPVVSLHPFDMRGRAWHMCADVRTPKAASQLAVTLIPKEQGPNAYFSNGARAILRGLLNSYILYSPDDWTFRDLILGCESSDRIRAILTRSRITQAPVTKYLDAKECSSVLSSLDTFLDPFCPIAACWARAEGQSLKDWVDGNFVLILPQDESARDALATLNGLIGQFLTEQLLARKTNEQLRAQGAPLRRTILFLDEVREIGQALGNNLSALLTKGRGYGVSCVLGYQSQPGLKDAMNPNRAPEVMGMCAYLGMLRVQEEETAKYLSDIISEREVYRKSTSRGDNGRTESWQLAQERTVMPAAFSDLPTETLSGYFLAPQPLGLWRTDMPWPHRVKKPVAGPPDFVKRPDEHQYLEPWNEADVKRLKLPASVLNPIAAAQQRQQGGGRPQRQVVNPERASG